MKLLLSSADGWSFPNPVSRRVVPRDLACMISRGNEQKAIVREVAERETRFDWLRRTAETYGWGGLESSAR